MDSKQVEAQARGDIRGRWFCLDTVFDAAQGTLVVDDKPIEIDRSAREVLLCLLRKAGQVVTKAELMEAGWPGRIVAENSLTKAIGRLRRALSDDDGRLIRAEHGYGYRLAAEARFVPAADADPSQTMQGPAEEDPPVIPGAAVAQFPDWRVLAVLRRDALGATLLAESSDPAHGKRVFRQTRRAAGQRRMQAAAATYEQLNRAHPGFTGLQPLLDWQLSAPPFTLVTPWAPLGNLREWSRKPGNASEDARPLRLRLLASLARTVADLHAIGIVHGDLRPATAYVVPSESGDPVVVLSAPGITDERLSTPSEMTPTAGFHLAPEVLAGDAPTARSDVYALGVLLFQSYLGDYARPLAPGWEEQIPDPLVRDDIKLAVDVDPGNRLATVQELTRRIGNHSVGQHASRELALRQQYAAHMRQTRTRVGIALTATVAFAVMLGFSLHQERMIATARDEALAAARLAAHHEEVSREVTAFLVSDVLGSADPYSRSDGMPDLREAMDRAARNLKGRFVDKPEVAAAIHQALGKSYQGLNEYGRANDHIDHAVELSQGSAFAGGRSIWLEALGSRCELAVYSRPTPEATTICQDAIREHGPGDAPPARAEIFLALAELRTNRVRDAQKRLHRVAGFTGIQGDPETLGYLQWFRAIAEQRLGNLEDAEKAFAALTENRRQHAGDPGMLLAWALSEQGRALLDLGRIGEGVAMLRTAKSMFDTVGGPNHPHSAAPVVHLLAHAAFLGEWVHVSTEAARFRAQRMESTGWDQWTLRLALLEARARARIGEHETARKLLSDIDEFRVRSQLDDNYPWLLDEILLVRAWTHLGIGDTTAARTSIEERSRLTLVGPSVPAHAYIAQTCLDAELARQESSAEQARLLESTCNTRRESQLPQDSLLLLNLRI